MSASVSIAGRELTLRDDVLAREQRAAPTLPPAEPVRLAVAALHLVLRRGASTAPGAGLESAIDWPATIALRERFAALGFGIGEAMDTAQRFSIGWPVARRLIEECGRLRPAHGFIAGAAADQLARVERRSQLVDAVVEQARLIQSCGGWPILLPQIWLVESQASEDEYVAFYRDVIAALDGPLFVHWLGAMFHPGLRGYFPGRSFERVMALDAAKVRGAKLSLFDREFELRVRRELLERDQIVLTGDDLDFADLIVGDAERQAPARWTEIGGRRVALGDFSHALLGVFDGCALPASIALDRLARGYALRARELLERCERLGRAVFEPPVQHYKAGLALISWLNGWQDTFALVEGEHRRRDLEHYARVAALASDAGALVDAKLAAERLSGLEALLG
jgi:hypothetical protein